MKNRIITIGFLLVLCTLFIIGGVSGSKRNNLFGNEDNCDERIVTFFGEYYAPLLNEVKTTIKDETKYVVEVEATGDREFVNGVLIQKAKFVKMIQGKPDKKVKEDVIIIGRSWMEDEKTLSTGFVNLMQKGDHYMVFLSDIYDDYSGNATVLNDVQDLIGFSYLNISRDESFACDEKEDVTKYKNVKGSEFITNDEETLKKIEKMKYSLMDKYGVKPLWEDGN